jgi:cytochrome P450
LLKLSCVLAQYVYDNGKPLAGTLIDIDLFSLHRNPLYWELHDKFMPERFIEGYGKHLYQYLPFSTGHRMYPAKKFMMTMIKTVVITFVERVKIRTVNNENQELNGTYIEVRPTSA